MACQRIARGKKFDASLDVLTSLGLSSHAIAYFLRAAYEARRLPHSLARDLAEAEVKQANAIVAAALHLGHPF